MSMFELIVKKVFMRKIIFIALYFFTGCSHVSSVITEDNLNNQPSCGTETSPKSLQFLEQQYRCNRP